MTVTLEVPDSIVRQLGKNEQEVGRAIMECAALQGYRQETLSRGQVRELLGLSWHETEVFLHTHNAELHYDLADLENDRRAMDTLGKQ